MKDYLGRKSMKTFAGLGAKTCSYLINESSEKKKEKSTKNVS